MEKRFVLFLVLSMLLLVGYTTLVSHLRPPPARPPAKPPGAILPADGKKAKPAQPAERPEEAPKAKEAVAARPKEAPQVVAPEPIIPEQWLTLGSADAADGYRMLVTLTNRGAAVARIELSSDRFRDLENRSGYLGHLVVDEGAVGKGCLVQVVGPGTPAARAGLKPGDLITFLDDQPVTGPAGLRRALDATRPDREITLTVQRGKDQELAVPVTLGWCPLEVTRPERSDPLSLLLTLAQVDELTLDAQRARDVAVFRLQSELSLDAKDLAELDLGDVNLAEGQIQTPAEGEKRALPLKEDVRAALDNWLRVRGDKPGPFFTALPVPQTPQRLASSDIRQIVGRVRDAGDGQREAGLFLELDGVNLRQGTWEVVRANQAEAVFRRKLPKWGLEVTKTFRVVKVPAEEIENPAYKGYHLDLDVQILNTGDQTHKVAYQLDGPTGLPTEGWWYGSKVGRDGIIFSSAVGLRDVAVKADKGQVLTGCPAIAAQGSISVAWNAPVQNIGVDAQYFSAMLIPRAQGKEEVVFADARALRVGEVKKDVPGLTNTTCRLLSAAQELKPGPNSRLAQSFEVFAGPKQPPLLSQYGLDELVYYGWFGWIARPMVNALHFFHDYMVFNYGLAIILLTVLVRGCMFPLSRKQALGAQKMQELQPEIKKIQEKYKNNMEARTKAQQELFRKHNYNPLSGCLVLFIQLPIFVALYRSLMVDVELRGSPLISHAIRWCSNLAAPDMLFDWSGFMPAFITSGVGIFGLGPYFNILPIVTIAIFIWQQKMFMPPPADEQAAMQQKVMQYMMIFMGILFYKVAAGLCIYFIASSAWSLAERKLLPKTAPAGGAPAQSPPPTSPGARRDGALPKGKKRPRGKK